MRRAGAVAAEIIVWWAAGFGVWLLTLSSVDDQDLIVATPLALGGAFMAVAARRALNAHWAYPQRAAAWATRLPAAIIVDTLMILSLPWRKLLGRLPDEGRLVRVPVAPGAESQPTSRRAAAMVLVSLTPGSYAVHSDDDTGELLVHSMGSEGRWSMTEVVRR